MPRKKAKKKEDAPTYYKAKNGRFYKKIKDENGRTRVRFVSNAEATGAITTSKSSKPKRTSRKKKTEVPKKLQSSQLKEEPAPSSDEKIEKD